MTQSTADAIVAAAYATQTLIDYERDVLRALGGAISSDVLFLCRGSAIGPGAVGVDPRIARRTNGRWRSYDDELAPVFDDARASGGVSVDADVLKGALVTTRAYREFIRPHGGRCTMLGIVSLGEERLATIARWSAARIVLRRRSTRVDLIPARDTPTAFTWPSLSPGRRGVLCSSARVVQ